MMTLKVSAAALRCARVLMAGWVLVGSALPARAGLGVSEIPGQGGDGPVTVYYPSSGVDQVVTRGRMTLQLAPDAPPTRGNGRLLIISHGSGGSPWVHVDLARALVGAGFIVALPEHRDDNYRHPGNPGPNSWKLRPAEVSRAIDAVLAEPRFAPLVAADRVGLFGGSAGGHTALSVAGGRWSPAGFKRHCQAHLSEDFQTCVGLTTRLRGDALDGLKQWLASAVIAWRFDDDVPQVAPEDGRIRAALAMVPAAADFDMDSLAHPRMPLGLITAAQDRWLIPRFHSDRVLAACLPTGGCERLLHLPSGGHGSMLSPVPPGLDGLIGELLNDPEGYPRAQAQAEIERKTVAFFQRHLLP